MTQRTPNMPPLRNREDRQHENNGPHREADADHLKLHHQNILKRQNLGPLHYDESRKPEDVIYGWVSYSSQGQDTPEELEEALHNGWTPVEASRHPEFAQIEDRFRRAFNMEDRDKHIIRKRGLVFMQLPKELHEKNQEFYRTKSRDQYMKTRQDIHNKSINPNNPYEQTVEQDQILVE